MARVITFSRTFPSYHPRAGEPTYFVEKIWKSLGGVSTEYTNHFLTPDLKDSIVWGYQLIEGAKHHTIRAGHRFKAGDWFSPRVWSGKPYNSKQIRIAPDLPIPKTFDFNMEPALWQDECKFFINSRPITTLELIQVAQNDGLTVPDFIAWFAGPAMASSSRKPFDGQIICWNESVNYL